MWVFSENVKKESGDEVLFSFSVQSLMNSSRLSVVLMLRVRVWMRPTSGRMHGFFLVSSFGELYLQL